MQIEPNKSPLRKRVLALLLGEIGHLSSPSRSCLGRLIFILGKADTRAVTTPSNKTVLNDVKGKYGRPETRDGVGGPAGRASPTAGTSKGCQIWKVFIGILAASIRTGFAFFSYYIILARDAAS